MKQLYPLALSPYTTKEIKPSGWLKQQLKIQAEGLSGNLDKIWPDVRDSRWVGGDKEGWERVPYWLDGFIPLAYLLEDEGMQTRAKKFIDAILAGQKEDGWICPCEDSERKQYDVWAAFLICKVLVVYYDCSKDERIEPAIYRAMKNLNRHIETDTLFNWSLTRWYECLIPLFWLYERHPEEWMLDLAYKLQAQGVDYKKIFEHWRFEKPVEYGRWSYLSHVVNLAMALKSEALMSRLTGEDGNTFAKQALALLQRDHGMATGHFTGDECLSGTSPIQGSECCSVVEAMYSYEHLLAITGDSDWGDILEKLAFNALPATLSPDMWTHQYDQQSNQVQCSYLPEDHVIFRTNSGESHLFGLEPNFGCCTANFNQGWPKFALSTFMKSPRGIAVTAIAPAVLTDTINGVPVVCEIETGYPFRDTISIKVTTPQPVKFELAVRIPAFCASAKLNGRSIKTGQFFRTEKTWDGCESLCFQLAFSTNILPRPNDMVCIERGPLLYAVKIKERWVKHEFTRDQVERRYPYCDYEIFAESKWNYALVNGPLKVAEHDIGDVPFSPDGAPISISAPMVPIDWGMEYGVCRETPKSREPLGSPEEVLLIPYGCTNLRLTEFPLVER